MGDGPTMVSAEQRSRRRVLLVTNIFPPQIGGPASFIDRLAHALVRNGAKATVVCASDDSVDDGDESRPFAVRRVPRGSRVRFETRSRATLAVEMARHRVVLVNGLEHQAAQAAAIVGRRYVLKVVGDTVWETARNLGLTTCSVDEFQQGPPPGSLARLAARRQRYLARAQLVITPSEYLRSMVVGWGVPLERVCTVYNGVDPVARAAPRRRTHPVLRVLFVGRLTNWKGVETLLLAIRDLPRVRATVVGDGPELPMLQALAQQLGIAARCEFRGRLSAVDTAAIWSEHDVLVLGSAYEGLSHVLLEASAHGLACVASDRGGNPEVVDGEASGLLFPYGDVRALQAALDTLDSDEERRLALASGALEASARFSFTSTVQRTMALLDSGEPVA